MKLLVIILLAFHFYAIINAQCGSQFCEQRSDCPSGCRCRRSVNVCVECKQNAHCAAREICENNVCIPSPTNPGCSIDAQCPFETGCFNGFCIEGACQSDARCEFGEACVQGFCVEGACNFDFQCEPGEICLNGQCIELECFIDAQCEFGEVCQNNFCVPGVPDGFCSGFCRRRADCSGTCRCNRAQNVCVQCTRNRQCNNAETCENGVCVPRGGGGLCFPPCPPDEVCFGGICVEGDGICFTTLQCEPGSICENNVCIEVGFPCTNDFQCEFGEERCINGFCIEF